MFRGGVATYFGIPYAAAPTGINRWQDPKPIDPWVGKRLAIHFAASCFQAPFHIPAALGRLPYTHEYVDVGAISEDCLYLNVWAPKRKNDLLVPVLVWIHGGGFGGGSGSIPIYNGSAIAARGVVVVTINYRVDIFGFFAHPSLTAESPEEKRSGNYGLLDIVAALRWVRDNIASFGGDPAQVTVAGQSAGAAAVMALIQMPRAQKLFSRAIAESGPVLPIREVGMSTAESLGQEFGLKLGATDLASIRAYSAAQLLAAAHAGPPGPTRFQPVIDGLVLRVGFSQSAADKIVSDVPLLIGMNANEAGPTSPLGKFFDPPVLATAANYRAKVSLDFSSLAPEVLRLYPVQKDSETLHMARLLARDRGLAAIIQWGRVQAEHSDSSIYAYLFNHTEPGPFSSQDGAFHTSEVPYVFGTLNAARERGFSVADHEISDTMQRYWINFIRLGNPNGPELNEWPPFLSTSPCFMVLDANFHAQALIDRTKEGLFDAFHELGGDLSIL
jgi:para-nitrobenzyl esterase